MLWLLHVVEVIWLLPALNIVGLLFVFYCYPAAHRCNCDTWSRWAGAAPPTVSWRAGLWPPPPTPSACSPAAGCCPCWGEQHVAGSPSICLFLLPSDTRNTLFPSRLLPRRQATTETQEGTDVSWVKPLCLPTKRCPSEREALDRFCDLINKTWQKNVSNHEKVLMARVTVRAISDDDSDLNVSNQVTSVVPETLFALCVDEMQTSLRAARSSTKSGVHQR